MSEKCPIAVVGVSALFPGSPEVTGFWNDILRGQDQVREIPPSYWLVDDYFDSDPGAQDKTYGKRGAFVDPVDFDCIANGVLPSQIQDIDTVQLMSLIVAQSVLRDAANGDFVHLDRSRMSVILGVAGGTEQLVQMGARIQKPIWLKSLREAGVAEGLAQDICHRIADHYVPWSEASFPGLLGNVVAGRIANRFDLGGTNCVVDAACASSSSALFMAVNELYLGDSDFVITGGADALNDVLMYMCFSKTPALSPSGDCRPFSDQADGTILGEGVGMVALRRLVDAERDGDTIYAVIKGVGSSSDGAGTAVYAPVSEGQAQALRRAYHAADFDPDTIDLIEAHGTGTKAGDKAEFSGLKQVFESTEDNEKKRSPTLVRDSQWCALGSVKSQIGHTKSAAGAASLIKTVLALHHKVLPPTIKLSKPNPILDVERSPFYLNTYARPWVSPAGRPRRAGVSSFGFGGSNFHVALEEYQPPQKAPKRILVSDSHLLAFSADSAHDLFERIDSAIDQLCTNDDKAPTNKDPLELEFLARTSQLEFDSNQTCRWTCVVDSIAALRKLVDNCRSTILAEPGKFHDSPLGWHYGSGRLEGKVACLFPGQGSQYPDMGLGWATSFSIVQACWDDFETYFRSHHANSESLANLVYPIPAFSDRERTKNARVLAQTQWAQPAIGAVSASLWVWLQRLGLRADGFSGHSFGELTALFAAGSIEAKTFIEMAAVRGQLMAEAAMRTSGAMTAVQASCEVVEGLVQASKHDDSTVLNVANINAPNQVVVSGAEAAIAEFESRCRDQSVSFTRLPVSTAFHSPIVSAAREPFEEHLSKVSFASSHGEVYANKTAAPYPRAVQERRAVLAEQIVSPVRFLDQIMAMHADGYRVFIEVGPGSVLTGLVEKCLQGRAHTAIATDKRSQSGLAPLWTALARMSALGVELDYASLWHEFREPDPAKHRPAPKLAVPISGINHGRPYPPDGGFAALPKPNVDEEFEQPMQPKQPDPPGNDVLQSRPPPLAEQTRSPQSEVTHLEPPNNSFVTEAPARELPTNLAQEWLRAFESIQRETNATHREYLHLSQQAMQQLGQLAGMAAASPPDAVMHTHSKAQLTDARNSPITRSAVPENVMPEHASSTRMDENITSISSRSVVTPVAPVATTGPGDRIIEPIADISERTLESKIPDVRQMLLDIVASKTGYPLEMLSLEMQLDADLGIDSIKRVEILAAATDSAPQLGALDNSVMATLTTLAEVADYIESQMTSPPTSVVFTESDAISQPAQSVHDAPRQPESGVDVQHTMLSVVADKTGYPLEMLELSMDLENDLGIDSIKRVEILSAVTEQIPQIPEFEPSQLSTLSTLSEITEFIDAKLGAGDALAAEGIARKKPEPGLAETAGPARVSASYVNVDSSNSIRYEVTRMPVPLPGLTAPQLAQPLFIMPAGSPFAEPLCEALNGMGLNSKPVDVLPQDALGVICLHGLRTFADVNEALSCNREVFEIACELAERLEQAEGVFISVQSTAEAPDLGAAKTTSTSQGVVQAWSGGMSGLAKTAAQEWPRSVVRSIDVCAAQFGSASLANTPNSPTVDLSDIAQRLAREIVLGGVQTEVLWAAGDERVVPVSSIAPVQSRQNPLSEDDVVLVTGGARGVTAASIVALCKQQRLRVVLLGRTKLDDISVYAAMSEAELMPELLKEYQVMGDQISPAALRRRVNEVTAIREINATLASIVETGSSAQYLACDIRDPREVGRAFACVRERWGGVQAVIHGAGVLADKLLSAKNLDHFDQVFGPKVDGLRNVLAATAETPLKLLCLFSSVAARTGNIGQSDYAMANEILNRVAQSYQNTHPQAKVVAINWGPWDSGMVDAGLKEKFENMGVSLIPLNTGARQFVEENLPRRACG